MLSEISLGYGLVIVLIAFLAEYSDSTLGMGYGTILTPVLLILGFEPLQVVPAVLLSELITGLLAGFTHHSMGNVDFRPKSTNLGHIIKKLKELGFVESFKRGIPLHLKVVIVIASCSFLGTVAAVFLAVKLPKLYLKIYIAVLMVGIGAVILATLNRKFRFSWKKITFLGLVASFNKGISGGGYGPVVTGGQLLAGVDEKNAIGITSLSEGLTCFVGVTAYSLINGTIDLMLAPYITIGAILSVPLGAFTVRKIRTTKLKVMIGLATIILGVWIIVKTIG
ncbi:MAG: sulfite exporter TauE/SafE family protein [Gemmatimonadota bacterium]|nr:sulfite exporter TauE/SafE family protein [Gemmatimonadota bacterium]